MRYVTINELSHIIRNNLWKIPHDVDLVVGIPRSGLMVANLFALYLNKRLSDIDSFINGHIYPCGDRGRYLSNEIRKVLVVDDSVASGKSMKLAKEKLGPLSNLYNFIYASPITTSKGKHFIDIYFEIIDCKRVFEWNLFHHGIIESSCFDIDGVLCNNPTIDDDGELYLDFIKTAPPLFSPTVKINTIITCRLEKYRIPTELWLKKNNIEYRNLIMLNLPDKKSRSRWGKYGEYKGKYYRDCDCELFVESSQWEASLIAKISKKPVICIESNELINIPYTNKFKAIKRKIRKCTPKLYKLMKWIKHN